MAHHFVGRQGSDYFVGTLTQPGGSPVGEHFRGNRFQARNELNRRVNEDPEDATYEDWRNDPEEAYPLVWHEGTEDHHPDETQPHQGAKARRPLPGQIVQADEHTSASGDHFPPERVEYVRPTVSSSEQDPVRARVDGRGVMRNIPYEKLKDDSGQPYDKGFRLRKKSFLRGMKARRFIARPMDKTELVRRQTETGSPANYVLEMQDVDDSTGVINSRRGVDHSIGNRGVETAARELMDAHENVSIQTDARKPGEYVTPEPGDHDYVPLVGGTKARHPKPGELVTFESLTNENNSSSVATARVSEDQDNAGLGYVWLDDEEQPGAEYLMLEDELKDPPGQGYGEGKTMSWLSGPGSDLVKPPQQGMKLADESDERLGALRKKWLGKARRTVRIQTPPGGGTRTVRAEDEHGQPLPEWEEAIHPGYEGRYDATRDAEYIREYLSAFEGHDVHINDDKKHLVKARRPRVGDVVQFEGEQATGQIIDVDPDGILGPEYDTAEVRYDHEQPDSTRHYLATAGALRDPKTGKTYDEYSGDKGVKAVVKIRGGGPSVGRFTGTVKDRQGRTICFRNGKRVPCPKKQEAKKGEQESLYEEEDQNPQQRRPQGEDTRPSLGPIAQIGANEMVEPGAIECEWYVSGGTVRVYQLCTLSAFQNMNRALRDGMQLDATQMVMHARLQRMFQTTLMQGLVEQKGFDSTYGPANDPKTPYGTRMRHSLVGEPIPNSDVQELAMTPDDATPEELEERRVATEIWANPPTEGSEPGGPLSPENNPANPRNQNKKALGEVPDLQGGVLYRGMDLTASPQLAQQFLASAQNSLQTGEPLLLAGYTPCTSDPGAEFFGNVRMAIQSTNHVAMGEQEALLNCDTSVVVMDIKQSASGWEIVAQEVQQAPQQEGGEEQTQPEQATASELGQKGVKARNPVSGDRVRAQRRAAIGRAGVNKDEAPVTRSRNNEGVYDVRDLDGEELHVVIDDAGLGIVQNPDYDEITVKDETDAEERAIWESDKRLKALRKKWRVKASSRFITQQPKTADEDEMYQRGTLQQIPFGQVITLDALDETIEARDTSTYRAMQAGHDTEVQAYNENEQAADPLDET